MNSKQKSVTVRLEMDPVLVEWAEREARASGMDFSSFAEKLLAEQRRREFRLCVPGEP